MGVRPVATSRQGPIIPPRGAARVNAGLRLVHHRTSPVASVIATRIVAGILAAIGIGDAPLVADPAA
jgi:hypothetical protein